MKDGEFYEDATFSEDHFPPKSVGGLQTLLVCKPCNDYYGSKMDHALKDYLKFKAFLNKKDNASYPLKFSYKGIPGSYRITTEWEKGNMVQTVNFKDYPLIKEWITDLQRREWSFSMKITTPAQDTINKALLRTGLPVLLFELGIRFCLFKDC